jgi:hypothetical protein
VPESWQLPAGWHRLRRFGIRLPAIGTPEIPEYLASRFRSDSSTHGASP